MLNFFNKDEFQKFLNELKYKFVNLEELKPSGVYASKGNSLNFINDEFVNNFNKKKYIFYQELNRILKSNPEVFAKIMYEKKLIKNKIEERKDLIKQIVTEYNKIMSVTDKNALKDENLYEIKLKDIKENEGKVLINMITNQLKEYYPDGKFDDKVGDPIGKETEIQTKLKKTFGLQNEDTQTENAKAGGDPFTEKLEENIKNDENEIRKIKNEEDYLKVKYNQNIDKMRDNYERDRPLQKYTEKLDVILNNSSDNMKKTQMLQNVLDDIEENETANAFKISKEDKLVFIGITFLIRLLSLSLIDWALNTNFVTSFKDIYILYVFLYSVFLLLIVAVVSVSYNQPVAQLYSGESSILSGMASTLYYFYLIPGEEFQSARRIIFHLGILYFISIVGIIIQLTGDKDSHKNETRYDYYYKKKIRETLSSFTLATWILLSILAMM